MTDLVPLSASARRVVDALEQAGGRPLVVGGAVRDALLPKGGSTAGAPHDVDIEVRGLAGAPQLIAALASLGRATERGAAFSIVALDLDGEAFEVSVPMLAGGRELDEVAASARRDFTINSMAWEPSTGRLIDPHGGAADLAAGVLRHTGDAFGDDPLRVLRGMQLAARFGLAMTPETAEVCRDLMPRHVEIAPERIWEEWRKLARRGVDITAGLRVLVETGWIDLVPELAATRGVEQDVRWHAEGDVFTHLGLAADEAASAAERDDLDPATREVVVLAALLHDLGKVSTTQTEIDADGTPRITSRGHSRAGVPLAERLLTRVGAPHRLVRRILPLIDEHMTHVGVGDPSAAAVRRLVRRLDDGGHGASLGEWARLVDADCAGRGATAKPSPAQRWLDVVVRTGEQPRTGLLTGDHLIARGLAPGPVFRTVLVAALEAQDGGAFDDEDGALRWLDASPYG